MSLRKQRKKLEERITNRCAYCKSTMVSLCWSQMEGSKYRRYYYQCFNCRHKQPVIEKEL